ncbi:MAG: hypothetical protein SF028_14815 [Candidatus Sumerlaeia bacterium]|nr:hypothetical protein [Candidatus Sumerlaeia bacterium]
MPHPFQDAFARLDTEAILELSRTLAPDADDCSRVAAAFGALADGEPDRAAELLEGLAGDGTAPEADAAYVRGFLLASQGLIDEAAEVLEARMADPDATHGSRMRLRAAECRIKSGQLQTAVDDLQPLLVPPGCDDTLEAHFLALEAMLLSDWEKEKIVEEVSLLDALLERGFRMREGENVLAAADLLARHRIEGVQERLYAAHRHLIEAIRTEDPEEIRHLYAEGAKWKNGGLLIAAARSYEEAPFAWPEEQAEAAAFQFAHHEEFRAAKLLLEATFDEDTVHANGDLWGPLLLCCYHGELWREALGAMERHAEEIAASPQAEGTRLMRAVALHHLGRHAEAAAEFDALGPALAELAEPHEAAAAVKALRAAGRPEQAAERARALLAAASDRPDWTPYFLNALVNESMFSGDPALFRDAVDLATGALPRPALADHLAALGELALAWCLPVATRAAADALAPLDGARAELLRALADADGSAAAAEGALAALERLGAAPGRTAAEAHWHRARLLYRMGRDREAMGAARLAADSPGTARRHLALELAARLLEASDLDAAISLRNEARAATAPPRAGRDASALREDERRHALDEERADSLAARLETVRDRAPDSSETQRLERRLAWLRDWAAPQG